MALFQPALLLIQSNGRYVALLHGSSIVFVWNPIGDRFTWAIVPRMHNLGQDQISDDLTGCWNEVLKENWKATSNRWRRRGELLTPHVAVRSFFSAIVISLLPSPFIFPGSISVFIVPLRASSSY